MPTPESILVWATAVANEWRWLAIVWHMGLAALLIALMGPFRPSKRLLGIVLLLPLVSVGVLAGLSRNPFNALTFGLLAATLSGAVWYLPAKAVMPSPVTWVFPGVAMLMVGWAYPHFLRTETWVGYAYASPFGLLPCPTLLVVTGITVMFGGLSTAWSASLVAAGVLYGFIGVLRLGVVLDIWLLAAAGLLGAQLSARLTMERTSVAAADRARPAA